MSALAKAFTSSIGKKVIMSLTGLFLCSFLIVHLIGNFQLFSADQGLSFNLYSVFMTTNPLIKTVSYLLYASILFHAFKGLYLAYYNKKARPVDYALIDAKENSHWTSRNMGILGTIILVFIVVHMQGFWYEYKFGEVPYTKYQIELATGAISAEPFTGTIVDKSEEYMLGESTRVIIVKDLFKIVQNAFKQWWLVLFYVISMAALSFHLIHGFKSAFQSLGLNHSKYNGIINFIGVWGFGIVIPIGFAVMPLYFLFIY